MFQFPHKIVYVCQIIWSLIIHPHGHHHSNIIIIIIVVLWIFRRQQLKCKFLFANKKHIYTFIETHIKLDILQMIENKWKIAHTPNEWFVWICTEIFQFNEFLLHLLSHIHMLWHTCCICIKNVDCKINSIVIRPCNHHTTIK